MTTSLSSWIPSNCWDFFYFYAFFFNLALPLYFCYFSLSNSHLFISYSEHWCHIHLQEHPPNQNLSDTKTFPISLSCSIKFQVCNPGVHTLLLFSNSIKSPLQSPNVSWLASSPVLCSILEGCMCHLTIFTFISTFFEGAYSCRHLRDLLGNCSILLLLVVIWRHSCWSFIIYLFVYLTDMY